MRIEKIIKKYRNEIVENLYKDLGYELDRIVDLDDIKRKVRLLIYVRE